MRGLKRNPFTKAGNPATRLPDRDIQEAARTLESLQNKDFPLYPKWVEMEKVLSTPELRVFKLCKVLYCLGYRKEMFLHLGTVVESRLNAIISLYASNNWRTPQNFSNQASQEAVFEQFIKKKALSEKADAIVTFNLFNDPDVCNSLRHKIQSFRFLRNYGGHSKSVNEFFQSVIESQPDCDSEIELAMNLIKAIDIAVETLKNSPPPPI